MINNIKRKGKRKHNKKNDRHQNVADPPLSPDFQAYVKLLQTSKLSTKVLIVLDVRNPLSCRYLPYEETVAEKMIFVLNKIDLVPREISTAWYRALSSVAPTFAVCSSKSVQPIEKYLTDISSSSSLSSDSAFSPESPLKVLITGIAKSGKKTILEKISPIPNVEIQKSDSWTWFHPTPDLVSLGASDIGSISSSVIANARDFLCRCSIHSLMDMFRVTFFTDVDVVLSAIEVSKRTAAMELMRGLSLQKIPYYTLPPASFVSDSLEGINEVQAASFKFSPVFDAFLESFIILGYGTQNNLKPSIIQICQNHVKKNVDKDI